MSGVDAVGVLASGAGTNLQALLDSVHGRRGRDRRGRLRQAGRAGAGPRARRAGVETRVFARDAYADRAARDAAIADWLRGLGVELVVLAGYMALLDAGLHRPLPRPHRQRPPVAAAGVPRHRARSSRRSTTACASSASRCTSSTRGSTPARSSCSARSRSRTRPTRDAVHDALRPLEHDLLPEASAGFARGGRAPRVAGLAARSSVAALTSSLGRSGACSESPATSSASPGPGRPPAVLQRSFALVEVLLETLRSSSSSSAVRSICSLGVAALLVMARVFPAGALTFMLAPIREATEPPPVAPDVPGPRSPRAALGLGQARHRRLRARARRARRRDRLDRRHRARSSREAGLDVRAIEDFTGFPEIMDGRVKTLHPKLYAGLLAVRGDPEHIAAAQRARRRVRRPRLREPLPVRAHRRAPRRRRRRGRSRTSTSAARR